MNPEMIHLVHVALESRYLMSPEAREQRQSIGEWFLRFNIEEADVDSEYDEVSRVNNGPYRVMIFGFRDPRHAVLFKLAWGNSG